MNLEGPAPASPTVPEMLLQQELFQGLERDVITRLAGEFEVIQLEPQGLLFRQGDPADALYFVAEGRLTVSVSDASGAEKVVAHLDRNALVGEMQLLTGGSRTATVRAETTSHLLRLSKAKFEAFCASEDSVLQVMGTMIRDRFQHNQSAAVLPMLFGDLSPAQIADIEGEAEWFTLPRGALLYEKGGTDQGFCILANGRLAVMDSKNQAVAEIRRGESVGEMSVLSNEPRAATIRAARDCSLLRFSPEAFDRLTAKHPHLLKNLARLIVQRFRPTSSSRSVDRLTVAVIPAGPGVPFVDFARDLAESLSNFGAARCVDAGYVDHALETPGISRLPDENPATIRLAAWLDEQEFESNYIVFVGDEEPSSWSQRCVAQSDCVLIVGSADGDPAPGANEQTLLQGEAQEMLLKQILVLLHPDGKKPPVGTLNWLQSRNVTRHHHVRRDTPEDVHRVARFLGGRAVGLALGGGGARGLAHIGVIRAMQEAGVPIDYIGGTSMGSIIGGQYALGNSAERIERNCRRIFNNTMYDLTLPLVSGIAGKRVARRYQKHFTMSTIEDLWLPYFAVSSNLSQARMMIHRLGYLWRAARASGGLPGLLPPVVDEGDLLVDGAFLNNLPADIMRASCNGGPVVAIDVSPPVQMTDNTDYGDYLSGWKAFWSKIPLSPIKLTLPPLAMVIQRASEVSSIARYKEIIAQSADLYLKMPVDDFDLLEFKSSRKIIAAGYDYAVEPVQAWWRDYQARDSSS